MCKPDAVFIITLFCKGWHHATTSCSDCVTPRAGATIINPVPINHCFTTPRLAIAVVTYNLGIPR